MLKIHNTIFKSRLFLGTGKFSSNKQMLEAIYASECELVTLSIRRIDLKNKKNHIYGKKRDFFWRLNTPERIAQANIEKIGLGILVGLSDNWRVDCYFLACHISYLRKLYWKSNYSISILRLRPCLNGMQPYSIMTDRELLQIMCAFRIFFPEIEISLSTRESATFRDHVSPILANNISAGSKTNPGGYITSKTELEQFYPQDNRSPKEVSNALKKYGLSSVWKDWDYYLGR